MRRSPYEYLPELSLKLASITDRGEIRVVAVNAAGDRFWPIASVAPELSRAEAADMLTLIQTNGGRVSWKTPSEAGQPLDQALLLAPIPRPPRNIMCVGKNYRSHAREFAKSGFDATSAAGEEIPGDPIVFTKPPTAVAPPYGEIPLVDGLDAAVDYEAELAVVIGTGGRFIRAAEAMKHVFGYTVVNDVTARDLQKSHKQWFLGKGIDGFAPMGPWIATAEEIDHASARVTCRVNGELRQDAGTQDLIFDIPSLIETISKSITLIPGDIIATGTPEGVGIGFNPPRFLKDGDVVECGVAGIGVIRNTVRRIAARSGL